MSECNSVESADLTYYQRNQDAILNRANTETYLKEKKKNREYGRNRYHNMSEEKNED